ncbi:hypothetical protein J437_LFUL003331 [Ladona fulva]|uniref:Ankyrin repeat protein n=1 Tax=Ladona fulva TaxID=123851 RepID=A0A8K0K2Y7_LADFU|nr:hypothetical protein J437_LFUL003331 [Ladona fulva]
MTRSSSTSTVFEPVLPLLITKAGARSIHTAAKYGHVGIISTLIQRGEKVDVTTHDNYTALHIAVESAKPAVVETLLGYGAEVHVRDRTPMHLAAERGHASVIELLADKFKASIYERTKDGSTLMHIASLNGHAECAMMLFKKGVYLHMPNKAGARSIHTAAKYGHVGIISTLIQRGEKVDVTTHDNYTALHIAVESAKPAVVETLLGYGAEVHVRARVGNGDRCALMLLKSGAAPNISTEDGRTPVHVAAKHGNLETLKLLMEDGGDPLYKSNVGETPLHLACRGCHADVVNHLLTFVADRKGQDVLKQYVNATDKEGNSALHCIAQVSKIEVDPARNTEDREVVKLLYAAGVDTSLYTKATLETAFHYCSLVGNNDVLQEMLAGLTSTESQKAINKQNNIGWTPLLIASNKGHLDICNTLLNAHARVDVFDNEGRSALHLASERGFLEVCDALLTHKAFINSKSRIGLTALHMAATFGFTHLVRFLIQDHNAVIDILTLVSE